MARRKNNADAFAAARAAAEKWLAFERKNAKSEAFKAAKFLAAFALVFFGLNFFLSFVPLQFFEVPVAVAIKGFLATQSVGARIIATEPVIVAAETGLDVSVSYLCTGLLESVVWIGIIAASLGVEWKKRLAGAFLGLAGLAAFNLLRIFTTLYFVLNSDVSTVTFIHNTFFRAALFAVLVGFYGIWFWLSVRSEMTRGREKGKRQKKQKN